METKKGSLLKKLIRLLLLILLITVCVSGIIRCINSFKESRNYAEQQTVQSARAISMMLDAEELKMCYENPDMERYEILRTHMRSCCLANNLEYVYIFIPDFEKKTISYIMTAARDEESHAALKTDRGAGVTVPTSYITEKMNAWNGSGNVSVKYSNNKYGEVVSSYSVVIDDSGEPYALVGTDYSTSAMYMKAVRSIILNLIVMSIMFMFMFFIIGVLMKKRIINPIMLVAKHMRAFTAQPENDFMPLDIHTNDEIEVVSDAFNNMGKSIKEHIKSIQDFTAKEARLNTEMEVARSIQYGIVASKTECMLSDTLLLSARMKSARVVGGDFYDYFPLGDGRYCVLIGDVSGKGIGAAMFMMLVKTILREKIRSLENLDDAISMANDEICMNNPENMFATVFTAVIDENVHEIQYVNAGHNPPVIANKDGVYELNVKSGIALGLFDDMPFTLEKLTFNKSDMLFLYTDGVTEAVNENNEFFGTNRLIDTIQKTENSMVCCDTVISKLREFRGSAEQFDDITMLAVYGGLMLSSDITELDKIKKLIATHITDAPLLRKINCICEEWFANIVSYSNADTIKLSINTADDRIIITFCDNGAEFNPVTYSKVKDFEDYEGGGMGINIIKSMSKDIKYSRENNMNIVTIIL